LVRNAFKLVESKGFEDLTLGAVTILLGNDNLQVANEAQVFDAFLR